MPKTKKKAPTKKSMVNGHRETNVRGVALYDLLEPASNAAAAQRMTLAEWLRELIRKELGWDSKLVPPAAP